MNSVEVTAVEPMEPASSIANPACITVWWRDVGGWRGGERASAGLEADRADRCASNQRTVRWRANEAPAMCARSGKKKRVGGNCGEGEGGRGADGGGGLTEYYDCRLKEEELGLA